MKKTNRALLTSVIALLLCCSMLVGSTFAWFTDSVSSSTNIIASGNLDVELHYSVDGTNWTEVDSGTEIFDDATLWEPGYTEVVYLKVVNAGSLALKYELGINIASEKPGVNTAGDAFKLSDHINMGVIASDTLTTFATREDAVAAVRDSGTIADYLANGWLESQGATYLTMVVYMPTTVGNVANHNGTDIPQINLGIELSAWQKDYEKDSFDKDYDAVVHTEKQLADALAAGGNIKVGSDIELTETVKVPAGKTAKLDLNGNTISGDIAKDAGAIIENNGTLTVVGGTVASKATNGAAVISNNGTLTLDGVTVNGAPMDATGYPEYAVQTAGKLIVEDGTVISANRGGIRTYASAEVIINGGKITVSDAADGRNMTLHTIYAYGNGSKLTINDGYFEMGHTSTGGASVICPAGATINIYGGDFRDAMDDTNWMSTGNFQNYMGYGAPVNVYGGTYDDKTVEKNLAAGYVAVPNGDGTYTVLPGNVGVNNTADWIAAINAGETNIALAPGSYVMPDGSDVDLRGKSLTITGTKGTVIEASHVDERDQFVTGATLKFEGVTLNFGTTNYMGFANAASLTYKDCAINGLQFCYGSGQYSFVDCDLNSNGAEHCVWTWGGQNVSFTGCDFTYGDRAANCYGEGVTTNASFTDCTFTKVAGKDTTGAIETNSSTLTALKLTINNCTINEGDLWWVSTWDSKGGANTYATVDGKVYVVNADQLEDAFTSSDVNVTLAAGEYKMPSSTTTGEVNISGTKDTVLDVTKGAYMDSAAGVTITGVIIKTSTGYGRKWQQGFRLCCSVL